VNVRRTLTSLAVVLVAAGCSSGGGTAASTPAPKVTGQALDAAQSTLGPTPTPSLTPSPTPVDCGPATTTGLYADMAAGSHPLNFTVKSLLAAWNAQWTDKKYKLNRVSSLTALGETAGFQSYGEFVPSSDQELMLFALRDPSGTAQAVGIGASPDTTNAGPLGPNATISSGMMLDFARLLFDNGDGVMNRLGLFFPVTSYDAMTGINACAVIGDRYVRLVDIPAVKGHDRAVWLFVRAAEGSPADSTPTSTPTANASGGSEYESSLFASFAPPLAVTIDPVWEDQQVLVVPSRVTTYNNGTWPSDFVVEVIPVPGGGTIWRVPNSTGDPGWTATDPFKAGTDPKTIGTDPLTFAGAPGVAASPKGAQLVLLIQIAAVADAGDVRFYWDGERFTCTWTGGATEKPTRGVARDSVHPTCAVETP
jgi:hypothetical protein